MLSFRQFMFPKPSNKPLSALEREIRRRGEWLSQRALEPTPTPNADGEK